MDSKCAPHKKDDLLIAITYPVFFFPSMFQKCFNFPPGDLIFLFLLEVSLSIQWYQFLKENIFEVSLSIQWYGFLKENIFVVPLSIQWYGFSKKIYLWFLYLYNDMGSQRKQICGFVVYTMVWLP